MTLARMFDASNPPLDAYPGCAAVAGYIGGNTPHVWSPGEWQRFSALRQFPIYVGYQRTNGNADGIEAAHVMLSLGWAPNEDNRRIVFLDMESQVNPDYVNAFGLAVWDAGFETGVYEDLTAYGHNPQKEGIWLAEWDDQADIPPLEFVIAHQYKPNVPWQGTAVDLSVITDEALLHGGVGPRQ